MYPEIGHASQSTTRAVNYPLLVLVVVFRALVSLPIQINDWATSNSFVM